MAFSPKSFTLDSSFSHSPHRSPRNHLRPMDSGAIKPRSTSGNVTPQANSDLMAHLSSFQYPPPLANNFCRQHSSRQVVAATINNSFNSPRNPSSPGNGNPRNPRKHRESSESESDRTTKTDTVKVVCRVRPFNEREDSISVGRSIIRMHDKAVYVLDANNDFVEKERFDLDGTFWSVSSETADAKTSPYAGQDDLFKLLGKPTLDHSWAGYHTCIFAYGQTGAGKTFTMMGSETNPGLIPNICNHLFTMIAEETFKGDATATSGIIKEYKTEASFLEIYNERVGDLLYQHPAVFDISDTIDHDNLRVRNIPTMGPFVVGLTSIPVTDWDECQRILDLGNLNRHVASTKMNNYSSRSHCIFRLTFTQTIKVLPTEQFGKLQTSDRVSRINLVDLAGSERNKKSGAQGDRLREASAINQSLTTLKNVIDALVEGRPIIPYRESQLTWLLSESIGGNSQTFMLACVSPHYDNAEETLNTLRYALRTRGIVCCARVNENEDMSRIFELSRELERLKEVLNGGGEGLYGKSFDEMKAELVDGTAMLARLNGQTEVNKHEEAELERVLGVQQEMRYNAAYHNSFRAMVQKKLMENILARQQEMEMRLKLNVQQGEELRTNLGNDIVEIEDLLKKEDKSVQRLRVKRRKVEELKDVNRRGMKICTDMEAMVTAGRGRLAHYGWQVKVFGFVFKMMCGHQSRLGAAKMEIRMSEASVRRLENVARLEEQTEKRKAQHKANVQRGTSANAATRLEIAKIRRRLDEVIVSTEEETTDLGAEIVVQKRETKLWDDDTERKVDAIVVTAERAIREHTAEWQAKGAGVTSSEDERLRMAIAAIEGRAYSMQIDSESAARRAVQEGMKRLDAVHAKWLLKMEFQNVMELCRQHDALTKDAEETLQQWREAHGPVETAHDAVLTALSHAVSYSNASPALASLAAALGTDGRLKSPGGYRVSRPSPPPIAGSKDDRSTSPLPSASVRTHTPRPREASGEFTSEKWRTAVPFQSKLSPPSLSPCHQRVYSSTPDVYLFSRTQSTDIKPQSADISLWVQTAPVVRSGRTTPSYVTPRPSPRPSRNPSRDPIARLSPRGLSNNTPQPKPVVRTQPMAGSIPKPSPPKPSPSRRARPLTTMVSPSLRAWSAMRPFGS